MGINILRWVCLFSVICCQVWTTQLPQKDHEDILQLLKELVLDVNVRQQQGLKIGAFNIQIYGTSKMIKPKVMVILVEILVRYDVVLIGEIRDNSGQAINGLLKLVNLLSNNAFKMDISGRLGRTPSREQYAYFYRSSKVEVVNTYQSQDTRFERPPYVVKFRARFTQIQEFGFIGIHTKPTDAVKEIDALVDVYDDIAQKWHMQDFIIGGDFNAGCSYVKQSDWKNIGLRTDKRFQFIIGDDVKTNVAQNKDCPYDRFVLAGANLMKAYAQGSAEVYRFDVVHHLTYQQTKAVSDHYPIEFSLK